MELQESDESNTLKKAPIDGLTKEELLKKYRQAILIAQKAKESKAGLLQHISKHEDTIKLLEDRLIKAVEEKKIEADLRANAEIELENTREVLANIKQENISATSPVVTYDDIHKECVSKVHISEDKVKTLEAKLLEVSNDLNTLGDSKLMLEKILVEKDNEIKSLIKHQNNENKVFEKCKTDLESEIHQLKDSLETETRQIIARSEESEKEIRSLEELLLQKDQDLKDLNSHFNDLKFSFEKLNEEQCERQSLLFNCENENAKLLLALEKLQKVIDEQSSDDTVAQLTSRNVELEQEIALKNEEILSRNEAMSQLSTECKETKDSLDQLKQLSKENFSKLEYLQGENTSYHQTISFLEKQKEEICYQVEELTRNIEEQSERNSNVEQKLFSVQEELLKKKNMIAQLSTELQEAKYSSDQLDKEYFSREDAIRSENSSLLQKIATLESEKTMLQETLSQNLEREMKDVKSETDTDEREIKNLQHLQTLLGERNEIISKMDIDMQSLSATLLEKEQNINLMAEEIRNVLGVLQERNLEIAKKDEVVAEMSRELAEAKNAMKILETQKFELSLSLEQAKENLEMMSKDSEEYVTKYATAIQDTEELHGQLNALQNTLQGKEFLIQDLELEISKLKDAVAHETTNTEVSSTFSLSRSEEISRMKDLEDSFEDKYTKLRVVAVKLKKRVTDLTQTLEGERSKMAAERSEFQAKLTQQASVAKTVQILQSEMDLLHDALDKQVKAYNQLSKDLESAVSEAASRKFELASTQEELLHAVNEQKSLEITIANMKSSVLMTEGLQVEIDQLRKEVEEKNCILDSLKDEKHKLCEQLEKVCSDAKKKSVLSLEMADLEKSVSELTRQLSSERDCLKQTTDALEQEHKLSISLQSKIRELEEKVNEKDRLCETLKEKLLSVREEEDSLKIRYKEKEIAFEELSALLEKQRSEIEELNLQCSDIASKQVQTKEVARQQIETLSRQIFQLEEQCTSVKEANKALQDELALVRTDFDNYKVRAQSVLRQSAKQEDRLLTSSTVHDAEELEVEVERLRVNVSSLNTNLKQTMSQLQGALQEVNVEREEKLRAFKQAQSYKDSCAEAVERQHAAEERLSAIIEESKQAKLHADTLIQCYKQQLEDLKTSHQKKVTALTEQLENLKASMKNSPAASHENERALSAQSNPSPVVDWAGQSPNTGQPDGDLAIRLSSLQREEGEGSESVDSFPTRRISVISQEKRHELVPLEKLLSSPTYPESDTTEDTRPTSVDKNVELLQSKLNACESRAAHLTALLSEAESDAARFSQLNIVLKEEIRRQQRCEERAQHAHNLEYLKNIVVKFITLQNGDERQRLVPVLNTILKLSPEEASLIAIVAKGSTQANNTARGWGSYLPLPGWSGS